MSQKTILSLEFLSFFIMMPISLAIPYDYRIKGILVLVGFIYILYLLVAKSPVKFAIKKDIDWSRFWKDVTIKFIAVAFLTALYVYLIDSNKLFCVPRSNPQLWIIILLVYTILSVWPQEIIYRTFFFSRYEQLFRNKSLLIFINAIVFSLAHIFFRNTLVLVLTFIGGLLFGYTYFYTRSTTLVSIEHALYGNWLFTVGMGEMLAFPGMESC